ncbi:MAG: hypothetical protein ACTS7D_01310 [Candidatus Hodgkinia cicadicola]
MRSELMSFEGQTRKLIERYLLKRGARAHTIWFDLTKRERRWNLKHRRSQAPPWVNITYSEVRRQPWWVRSNVRSYEIEMETLWTADTLVTLRSASLQFVNILAEFS